MNTRTKKPRITDDMAIRGFKYLVECAGFDYEADGFNPDHVGKALFEKGYEAGYAEAQRIASKKVEQLLLTEAAE